LDILQGFLKREKIRTKKLLQYFQNHPDHYLAALKEGVWLPFVQINSIEYVIKIDGYDPPFDDGWELKMEYDGFNMEIKDVLWFSDTEPFKAFDIEKYQDCDAIFYQALHLPTQEMITLYSGYRYDVPSGKYLLSIKGYRRKAPLEFPSPNNGFLFSLVGVDEFDGFNNPRENELYDFNIANM
jgi:hypothetical protein